MGNVATTGATTTANANAEGGYNGRELLLEAEEEAQALRGAHLLRNQTRVDFFDVRYEDASLEDGQPNSKLSNLSGRRRMDGGNGGKPTSAAKMTLSSLIAIPWRSKKRREKARKKISGQTASPSRAVATQCKIVGCSRLTRRWDRLCPAHAEQMRAIEEVRSGSNDVKIILEAKIVGFESEHGVPRKPFFPAARAIGRSVPTHTVYRINLLQWHFEKNELYEWSLRRRFSSFDKMLRDLVAVHGALPPKVRLPEKLNFGVRNETIRIRRCKSLQKLLNDLLSWHATLPEPSPVLVEFLEIQGERIDKMAQIGQTVVSGSPSGESMISALDTTATKAMKSVEMRRRQHHRMIVSGESPQRLRRRKPNPELHSVVSVPDISSLAHLGQGAASISTPNFPEGDRQLEGSQGHVIVTLGGPLNPDMTPSLWLKSRIEAGTALYHRHAKICAGPVYMVVTGGDCGGHGTAEAEVMRRIMVRMGVPDRRILPECQAKDTIQNALLVVPLLIRLGIYHVSIVTSEFHIRRTKHYFETIFAAYSCSVDVRYVACEDHMTSEERSLRDRKETLLTARSQGLLDRSVAEMRSSLRGQSRDFSCRGRHSWSFSLG